MTQLSKMKVREIMKTEVVRLEASARISDAIRTLDELEISGAPVVDSTGRLVGVLSARDVSRTEHVRAGRLVPVRGEFGMGGPLQDERDEEEGEERILEQEDYSAAILGEDTVADWMNPHVVTVAPDDSLRKVCQRMIDEHVHRVIVAMDGKVAGILTSLDVVELVAQQG